MVVGFGMGHGLGQLTSGGQHLAAHQKSSKEESRKHHACLFISSSQASSVFPDSEHKLFINEGSSANPTPFVWNPHCIFTHILMHVKSHAPALNKYNIFSLATVWSHLTPFTSHPSPNPKPWRSCQPQLQGEASLPHEHTPQPQKKSKPKQQVRLQGPKHNGVFWRIYLWSADSYWRYFGTSTKTKSPGIRYHPFSP